MTAQAFTGLGPREQLAALIDVGSCEFLHSTSPQELSLAIGLVENVPIIAAAQHGEEQGGTLGAAHTGALLDLVEIVRARRPEVLLLLLDSGGVRLQEGNRGMAGLARVITKILGLRRAGVVCIAIIGGRVGCWGGATLIAAACDKVLMVQNTRYGLSGPKVLWEMAKAQGQVLDLDSLRPYLTPQHRQFTHEVDLVVTDEVMVVRNALAQVIGSGGVDPLAKSARVLEQAGQRMGSIELVNQEVADALPGKGPAPPIDGVLDRIFTTYTHRVPVTGVVAGRGEVSGTRISFLGCTGEVAMGPAQGVALMEAALAAVESGPGRVLLFADAIQAFHSQNEQYGYGQVLGGLLQVLWYIHISCCPVIGVVRHAGSGASMVALAMGGITLYAYSGAQIYPLPPNVVAAFGADIDRDELDASPAPENFARLGVIREVWVADHAERIRNALLAPAVVSGE